MYVLTAEDIEVFKAAQTNGSIFTRYYFDGWEFDPWQLAVHHAYQSDIVVVGGFGSGKTHGIARSGAVYAAMTPGFKFYDTSVTHEQAYAMFQALTDSLGEGVPFYDRFIGASIRAGAKIIEKPHPKIVLVYGLRTRDGLRKCRSELNFLSADRNASKIKNLEGDYVIVDQAEMVVDLATTVRNLGTRARGRRPDGTPRLGRIVLLANSEDSPELWSYYDRAELDQERYLALTVSTYDNLHLTAEDWVRLKDRVSFTANEDEIAQHLLGARPVGSGKYFPAAVIAKCADPALDSLMEWGLKNKKLGFLEERREGAGVITWQLPPAQGRQYLQMGDPGSGMPPERGAPVIGVWDITDFPREPASLQAFWWGVGGGQIMPFLSQFNLWQLHYRTQMRSGWDDTGMQKFLSELNWKVESSMVQGLNFSSLKPLMLNAARLLCEKALFRWPRGIRGIAWQLARYDLPDDRLPQDIVCMLMMTAFWLAENYGYDLSLEQSALPIDPVGLDPRGQRPIDRDAAVVRLGRM